MKVFRRKCVWKSSKGRLTPEIFKEREPLLSGQTHVVIPSSSHHNHHRNRHFSNIKTDGPAILLAVVATCSEPSLNLSQIKPTYDRQLVNIRPDAHLHITVHCACIYIKQGVASLFHMSVQVL